MLGPGSSVVNRAGSLPFWSLQPSGGERGRGACLDRVLKRGLSYHEATPHLLKILGCFPVSAAKPEI